MYLSLTQSALLLAASPSAIATAHEPVVMQVEQEAILAADPEEQAPSPEAIAEAQDGQPEATPADETPADDAVVGDVIIVESGIGAPPGDPLVNLNETTFEVSQKVDAALVAPVAEAYEDTPKPLRNGLRNFLRNLMEPVNAINYLLQLNPGKAIETVGRFVINTTLGVGGLFDVAGRPAFNLPYHRNGFGNTLGYYGVGPGPFLVLPLVGATTVRDLVGSTLDQAVIPFAVGAPFNTPYYAVPAYTVNSLQWRMENDDRMDAINDSVYPYYALRESYLCHREAEIAALRNRPAPRDCDIDAIMAEDEEPSATATDTAPEAPVLEEEPVALFDGVTPAMAMIDPVIPMVQVEIRI